MTTKHLWGIVVGHLVTGTTLVHRENIRVAVDSQNDVPRLEALAKAKFCADWDSNDLEEPRLIRADMLKIGIGEATYLGTVECD